MDVLSLGKRMMRFLLLPCRFIITLYTRHGVSVSFLVTALL